jgi:oligoendopeptidase F
MEADLATLRSRLSAVIQKIPSARLEQIMQSDPLLMRYQFFVSDARRAVAHTLSPEVEAILQNVGLTSTHWEYPAYRLITAQHTLSANWHLANDSVRPGSSPISMPPL